MKKIISLLLLACLSAAVTAAEPGGYDYGMAQRRSGDYEGARKTFMRMLLENPASGGALEGLSLSCLALGRYEEARIYLQQWSAQSPGNPYILGLLARAQNSLRDEEGALRAYEELVACDPRNCAARYRMDSGLERLRAGVFPRARTSKSYSVEGVGTANTQTIIYEGASAAAGFRVPLRPGLDLTGGAELRQEAQRNDSRGFTYYDILEQAYTAGLNWRPAPGASWEAEFGKSVLTDIEGDGVGYKLADRARLGGRWYAGGTDFRASLSSQPKFLRGSGESQYFRLLRETAARAEAERGLWGWNWILRAGVFGYTGGTSLGAYSLRALKEFGPFVFQSGFSHGQQEFYSASASGKLRYVNMDRVSAGLRRTSEDRYRVGASYAHTAYSDTNSLKELDFDATLWLPRNKEFYGTYRFNLQDFRAPFEGYSSSDERSQWLGAYWRRCRGREWSALLGFERGFLKDKRSAYGAERLLGELELYRGGAASLRLQGSRRVTTGRGRSRALGLQARYSF